MYIFRGLIFKIVRGRFLTTWEWDALKLKKP
jgi:hypothetical protein